MESLFLVGSLAVVTWYWWDTMQCKEIAKKAGKQACLNAQVQFLDDTVALKKLWLRRAENGRLQLCRIFFFEFASDGLYRYQGRIVLTGKRVREVDMDAYRISE
ncbi:MAG: hypothetical protein AMJ53_08430 [Gammaproteobacteria bacterium SG8_11]|nr:MAG: hypothetical protein AMJ53_08430 [Gammaproteobacteria bacterium SG8_11]